MSKKTKKPLKISFKPMTGAQILKTIGATKADIAKAQKIVDYVYPSTKKKPKRASQKKADTLSTDTEKFIKAQKEGLELFKRKNREYGSAFRENGPVGMIIRLGEKLNRYKTINKDVIKIDSSDESLRDTLLDIHNCSALALLLLDEEDENCENPTDVTRRLNDVYEVATDFVIDTANTVKSSAEDAYRQILLSETKDDIKDLNIGKIVSGILRKLK